MTCADYRTTEALNSHLETNPDLDNPELGCLLRDLAEQARLDRLTYAAFPAEAAQEAGPRRFDTVLGDEDVAEADQQDVADAEQDMLDHIPFLACRKKRANDAGSGRRCRSGCGLPSGGFTVSTDTSRIRCSSS